MTLRFALVLTAVTSLFTAPSAFATFLTDSKNTSDQQIIGGNYHGTPHYFDPGIRCIQVDETKDVESFHNASASVVSTTAVDYNTLERELGTGFSASGSTPYGDPLSLKFNFLKNAQESNNTIVFSYRTIVNTGSLILKSPHKLTPEAIQSLAISPQEFENYCGDQYVNQIDKGAKAYVAIKIELESERVKRLIESEIGVSVIDFFSLTSNFKKLRQKYGLTGTVTIAAYQEGGFPARINSIFGTGEGMSQCNGSTFAKCEVLLKEVVNYFAHDFAEQFDSYYRGTGVIIGGGGIGYPIPNSSVVMLPPTAKTLSYTTQSYCKLAASDRPPQLNCPLMINTAPDFEGLTILKDRISVELQDIQKIRNGAITLAPDYLTALGAYEKDLYAGLGYLDNATLSCKRDPWSCESTVREIKKVIPPIRSELLASLKKEERFELCLDSGENNEVLNYRVRLYSNRKELKTVTILGSTAKSNRECFQYFAPEVVGHDIDAVEIQIQKMKEENSRCSRRVERKFSTWANWDLKSLEITQLSNGKKYSFEGKRFNIRPSCESADDKNDFLPWVALSPQ